MKTSVIYKTPEPPPIEKIILEVSPDELRLLRYFALAGALGATRGGPSAAAAVAAAYRFLERTDKLPFNSKEFNPEKCFLED
jgi:hypothetical protein